MGADSRIEWTDATWTPIRARNKASGKVGWHCEHVSDGCRVCYAEVMNRRLGTGLDFKPGHRRDIDLFLDEHMLLAPLRWRKPRMVFVCSMTDLFAEFVPDEWIDRMFAVMALCPQHTFQVLTKRSARMREYLAGEGRWYGIAVRAIEAGMRPPTWPLPNVWLGVSCEDQEEAERRIPHLLAAPARIKFISAEPLLGPIDFFNMKELAWGAMMRGDDPRVHWIIAGGESGPGARPMHPDWARSIRDQCEAAGVPFLFKQWGEWIGEEEAYNASLSAIMQGPSPSGSYRVGKHRAGRLLDGRTHDGFPA